MEELQNKLHKATQGFGSLLKQMDEQRNVWHTHWAMQPHTDVRERVYACMLTVAMSTNKTLHTDCYEILCTNDKTDEIISKLNDFLLSCGLTQIAVAPIDTGLYNIFISSNSCVIAKAPTLGERVTLTAYKAVIYSFDSSLLNKIEEFCKGMN